MKKAICVLTNNQKGISGVIKFKEISKNKLEIDLDIKGLSPGYHGFHIHNKGDLTKGCSSLCSHFNPFNTTHGDITDDRYNRHVGDLGNIIANKKGIVKYKICDNLIKLRGKCNIIGRSVVIHKLRDDLGRGGMGNNGYIYDVNKFNESQKTGNAGERIACGIIGWA